MADDNKTISDNAITVDAKLYKLPEVLLPVEDDEEAKPKLEENLSPKDVISNSSMESTVPLIGNKQKLKSTTYEMEKYYQHAMLVLNHNIIKGYKLPRLGTEKDVKALEETFGKLGFTVEVKHDPSKEKVMKELKEFCGRDFSRYGCVVVVVLTHGFRNGDLVSSDGKYYHERNIVDFLKCSNNPTLAGKPRILVIQACRGADNLSNTKGVRINDAEEPSEETLEARPATTTFDPNAKIQHYFLPVESNMLVVHSSYLGKNSFRNIDTGSWLIEALCSKINQFAWTLDLDSILTEMKREVAIERHHVVLNRKTFKMDELKQMPVTTSTLTRKLYLRYRAKPAPRYDVESYKRWRDHQSGSVCGEQQSEAVQKLKSAPPLRVQYGPCFCFLDRYNYMLNCLNCYLEHHSDDEAAQMCASVAKEFENGPAFHGTKEKMLKNISKCLDKSTFKYHKFMHFYN